MCRYPILSRENSGYGIPGLRQSVVGLVVRKTDQEQTHVEHFQLLMRHEKVVD